MRQRVKFIRMSPRNVTCKNVEYAKFKVVNVYKKDMGTSFNSARTGRKSSKMTHALNLKLCKLGLRIWQLFTFTWPRLRKFFDVSIESYKSSWLKSEIWKNLKRFDVLSTNFNHFLSCSFFTRNVFGTLRTYNFCVVYSVNLLNIGLQNGESWKTWLTDQIFDY